MTDKPVYIPFDREAHLGKPPWKHDDPAVVAWEAAHGHDVRMKCYPEFGCMVIESSLEAEIDRLKAMLNELPAELLHPEFGTEWREPDGVIWKARQEALNPDDVTLNRMAQLFYEASGITLPRMTDKPKVVEGLRAVFAALRGHG